MKFSQLEYTHLEYEEVNGKLVKFLADLKKCDNSSDLMKKYIEANNFADYISSSFALAYIRNSLNTEDEYYSKELAHCHEIFAKLGSITKEITKFFLNNPFRKEIEAKWGTLMFKNEEMSLKIFSDEIIEDLQEESKLKMKYTDLMASAKINFDGKELNLSQLSAYMEDLDVNIRRTALEAKANWFLENSEKFDNIFDELTNLRTAIAKKLGYENFIELGYYRMKRNSYDSNMVSEFRRGVLEHIVPIVNKLKEKQAERINVEFPIKMFNSELNYLDGNAKPQGTEEELLAHAQKMYKELDSETGKFFDMILERELIDVKTRPGKSVGGYCYMMNHFKVPFIFANFNGTSGDVDVLTHEVGHAFAGHMSKDLEISEFKNYTSDVAEIHSMAMEFLTWPWMDGFFKEQTQKYYEIHLESALDFLPYGCMVDEFQHDIYENHEMTPEQRNEHWLSLEKKYRPWLDTSEVPFYNEGRRWQNQSHIYKMPFYYIDYCLAQVISLFLWAKAQENHEKAWEQYKKLVSYGGTKTFLELIEEVGLPNPFIPGNLKLIADEVTKWLEKQA